MIKENNIKEKFQCDGCGTEQIWSLGWHRHRFHFCYKNCMQAHLFGLERHRENKK